MRKMIVDMGGFTLSRYQKNLVNKVLDSGRITYGKMTQKFERMWAELHGVKYALFCNSGTSALQVAIHALKEQRDWKDGDEIIIPSVTFVATMNVVLHNNMKPVFADVSPVYYNIDPEQIEKSITKKTQAIIVVHLLGQPAEMDRIMEIAGKYGLAVIEDSCETVGVSYKGKMVGSWGDVGCFSTYASHLVVTGVGGFACTNDDDLAVRIKGLYNHGRDGIYHSIDDNKKGLSIINSRFNFTHSGYSYRCTELEAALGIGHLKRFKKELKKRQNNAEYLTSLLKKWQKKGYIFLPHLYKGAKHSYMLYGIQVSPVIDRDDLIIFLEKNGVKTRFMMPLLNQPIVKTLFGGIEKRYKVAWQLDHNAFLIGMHAELTKKHMNYVADVFEKYFTEHGL
jgi:perosamine synthetase